MTSSQAEALRVLIVDDDPQMLRTITDILRMNGYAPSGATTGSGGLERAAKMEHLPAIALVELSLPVMVGSVVMANVNRLAGMRQLASLIGIATVRSALGAFEQAA